MNKTALTKNINVLNYNRVTRTNIHFPIPESNIL